MSVFYEFGKLLSFFIVNCFLPIFIFFPTLTLAMKDRDSNLRIKEIFSSVFEKLF